MIHSFRRRPTTVKQIPQVNTIIEHKLVQELSTCLRWVVDDTMFAIHNLYQTKLKSTPRAAIFGRDMLLNNPYVADWNEIGRRRL